MKISQAVLLLASSSSAENIVLDRTRQIDIGPSEDGIRSGKAYVVTRDSHAILNSVFGICESMCKLQQLNSFNSGLF